MVRPNWYMVEKKKVMLQTFIFNLLFPVGQLLLWRVWEFAFSILASKYEFLWEFIRKAKNNF